MAPSDNRGCRIDASILRRFVEDILHAVGMSEAGTAAVSDSLIYAELCGIDSHGLTRLPIYARRIAEGAINGHAKPHVLETSSLALRRIDGDNGAGAVVGSFAMREAIATAKAHGAGIALANHSSHFGAAAYYTHLAADAGCIGICAGNAPLTMAAWGSREPSLGTNPISFAAPGGRFGELNLDMSSSIVAKGKVLSHLRKGLSIPLGWALDTDGKPTTDAAAAAAGVVLPFAGPKGSGLALFIDVIAGVLSGAAFGGGVVDQYAVPLKPQNAGQFFIAIDIAAMMPLETFTDRVEALCTELKGRQLAEGFAEVSLPGEGKAGKTTANLERGIEVDPTLLQQLDEMARQFGRAPLTERLGET